VRSTRYDARSSSCNEIQLLRFAEITLFVLLNHELEVDYIKNGRGNPQTVQLSFTNYKKLMAKLEKYEQMLKIKSDLTRAF
jgi:hypothetical protein